MMPVNIEGYYIWPELPAATMPVNIDIDGYYIWPELPAKSVETQNTKKTPLNIDIDGYFIWPELPAIWPELQHKKAESVETLAEHEARLQAIKVDIEVTCTTNQLQREAASSHLSSNSNAHNAASAAAQKDEPGRCVDGRRSERAERTCMRAEDRGGEFRPRSPDQRKNTHQQRQQRMNKSATDKSPLKRMLKARHPTQRGSCISKDQVSHGESAAKSEAGKQSKTSLTSCFKPTSARELVRAAPGSEPAPDCKLKVLKRLQNMKRAAKIKFLFDPLQQTSLQRWKALQNIRRQQLFATLESIAKHQEARSMLEGNLFRQRSKEQNDAGDDGAANVQQQHQQQPNDRAAAAKKARPWLLALKAKAAQKWPVAGADFAARKRAIEARAAQASDKDCRDNVVDGVDFAARKRG
jgi:hypothetical protein